MREQEIDLTSSEGQMGTFIVCPDSSGPHPVVVFLMDAPGKRPLLHDMARRIASQGFYVMLPNLYYRKTEAFELDFGNKESLAQMRELMMGMSNAMVARDVGSLLAHAAADPSADAKNVGCVGYCMSGPFALWVAAEFPDQIHATASFYGVRLHVDAPDSPHLRLAEIKGEVYVGCAEHDDYVPLEMVDNFEQAMIDSKVNGKIERYWGLHHGFAFNDRPAYDAEGDRRHWEVLEDLFERNVLNHE